jgi:hypothetical protein
MRKLTLIAILGLGLVSPAVAADLPARPYSAPASYVPIYFGQAFTSVPTAVMGWPMIAFRFRAPSASLRTKDAMMRAVVSWAVS